jgi:RNA polymerase sigma-70 factor, ECF subfamily
MTATATQTLDREGLARVLAEEGDRLYALALRVTRDPDLAAEAVQEAFTKALESLDTFRGESRPGTWLYRIVYTKSIDLLRRRRREQSLPENEDGEPEVERSAETPVWSRPPDEILSGAEARAALEHAVDQLTPVQRAIVELVEMDGHTSEDAGRILGLAAGTVRVYLHRARLRLRELLAGHVDGGRT